MYTWCKTSSIFYNHRCVCLLCYAALSNILREMPLCALIYDCSDYISAEACISLPGNIGLSLATMGSALIALKSGSGRVGQRYKAATSLLGMDNGCKMPLWCCRYDSLHRFWVPPESETEKPNAVSPHLTFFGINPYILDLPQVWSGQKSGWEYIYHHDQDDQSMVQMTACEIMEYCTTTGSQREVTRCDTVCVSFSQY